MAFAQRTTEEKNPENNGSKDEAKILWILRRIAPQNDSFVDIWITRYANDSRTQYAASF